MECADIDFIKDGVFLIFQKDYNPPKYAYCVLQDDRKWTVSILSLRLQHFQLCSKIHLNSNQLKNSCHDFLIFYYLKMYFISFEYLEVSKNEFTKSV